MTTVTFEMTPGFKPFTVSQITITFCFVFCFLFNLLPGCCCCYYHYSLQKKKKKERINIITEKNQYRHHFYAKQDISCDYVPY